MCSIESPSSVVDASCRPTDPASVSGPHTYSDSISAPASIGASADGAKEIWKPVAGFEGHYEISNSGRLRHVRVIESIDSRYGYARVQLRAGGRGKRTQVHRLVLEAFVGPCPAGMEACHGNGVRADNRLENLRWDTRVANFADRDRHGNTVRGEKSRNAKLTEADVRLAYSLRERQSVASIAKMLGVTSGMLHAIFRGRTWKHVR